MYVISHKCSQKKQEIVIKKFKPLNPTRIAIFDSYAGNEENEHSDIGLLYSTMLDVSFYDRMRLKFELSKVLEKNWFRSLGRSQRFCFERDAVTFYKLENAKSRTE
ncbi:MAG: hypothetical protein OXE77_11250 [Flavobacteriaceae bacterium]|nr:hypothetical protein [Flavobacteriaceae bacterium]MCY4268396.1 hypothetical protein [Flavobacteriaceae bacterium]MCY4298367.1 hypothetical protein [Flavobacteriaceae bacterium]